MVLEGNLSTDKGTQTQPNYRSQDRVWRKGQDCGPGEGQTFLLTEAALPLASSSLTLMQTFLLGGEPPPSPHEGGSKRKLSSIFVWVHRREHQAWQTGLRAELGHCRAEPAGLLGAFRVAVVSDFATSSACAGPRHTDPPAAPGCGAEERLCSHSPPLPRASHKAIAPGSPTNSHRPNPRQSRGRELTQG